MGLNKVCSLRRASQSTHGDSCRPPHLPHCRRFVWNFFRLENEHLNNCGEFRAVRDISVAPLNADDQTLLEQMMDQEDGVRNRSGKKTWKRSHSLSLRRPLLSTSQSKKDTKVLIEDTDDEAFS